MKMFIPESISKPFIYACMGFGVHEPDEKSKALVEECSHLVLQTAEPRLVYKEFDINEVADLFEGEDLSRHLAGFKHCVLMALTLGMSVDKLIRKAEITDMFKAMTIDACASSLVEDLCDQFSNWLEAQCQAASSGKIVAEVCEVAPSSAEVSLSANSGAEVSAEVSSNAGAKSDSNADTENRPISDTASEETPASVHTAKCRLTTTRFSPGYGDLPLNTQKVFEHLLDMHRQIGLSHSKEFLLTPRKSVTAIIGIRKNDFAQEAPENEVLGMTKKENNDNPGFDMPNQAKTSKTCENCKHYEGCTFRLSGAYCGK